MAVLINNVEDILVFLGLNVDSSDDSYMFFSSRNETFVENNQFSKLSTWINKYLIKQDTVVYQTLTSMEPTVPFKGTLKEK